MEPPKSEPVLASIKDRDSIQQQDDVLTEVKYEPKQIDPTSKHSPELLTEATLQRTSYLSSWRLAIVTSSLCLGTLLVAIDTTIISVAIPRISTDFKALDDVGWYGSAYLLTVTAFQPAFGSIYKFFDAKSTYLTSILTFEGMLDQIVNNLKPITSH